jgi:histidinol-phosphate aminotransferase
MEPYSPGKPISEVQRELGLGRVVKLASNENPLGPSPAAIAAVRAAAEEMHLYPDASAYALRKAISERFNMPMETIFVGNGSDELIHMLGLLFLDSPNDEMIVGDPSFVRYDAAAQLAPAKLIKVPLDANYRHDLPAMARAASEHTKLIFIANPNNPTGTIVRRGDLDRFLADLPSQATVVLDEAYFEFASEDPEYPVSIDYVRAGKPVIGLRTFSKTYGLAGIRIGYGFASAEIFDAFNRAREPFNANALAQAAAIAALGDVDHITATVENNRRGMARMVDALTRLGPTPCESHGNFVFVDLHRPAQPVFRALLERGVIVRSGEVFGTPTCIRVSVGTDDEVEAFVEAIEAVLKEPVTL